MPAMPSEPLYPERHSKQVEAEEIAYKIEQERQRKIAEKLERERLAREQEERERMEKEQAILDEKEKDSKAPSNAPFQVASTATPTTPESDKVIAPLPTGTLAAPPAAQSGPTAQPVAQAAPAVQPALPPAPATASSQSSSIAPIPAMVAESIDVIEPGVYVEKPGSTVAVPFSTATPSPVASAPSPTTVGNSPAIAAIPSTVAAPSDTLPFQASSLPDATRQALAKVPANLDAPAPPSKGKIDLKRVSPDIAEVISPDAQGDNYQAAGIKINVRSGVYDSSRQLSRAYDALMADDEATAISIYHEILMADPKNEEALFGIAATYHRAGVLDKARSHYVQLLELNPSHREALTNFLALVSAQAPEDALVELEKLAARNPDFSPIHAQIGVLYGRLGAYERAREKLLYAIQLSPENLVYQYNLAVMLDTQGQAADAAALYQKILAAHGRGSALPVAAEHIQKRLNYLVSQNVHPAD